MPAFEKGPRSATNKSFGSNPNLAESPTSNPKLDRLTGDFINMAQESETMNKKLKQVEEEVFKIHLVETNSRAIKQN